MKNFVGVRMVKANSMDLSLFQFDYDMTFAAFFMNADRTIYGRYGTRSEYKLAAKEISLPGFKKALEGALKLHGGYPGNRRSLRAKTGPAPRHRIPEQFPTLRNFKRSLDYKGNVFKSCIHCHQVLDAQRDLLRSEKKPFPDNVLFPYPMPKVVGMVLDPQEEAKVSRVLPDSPAAKAGVRVGDEFEKLDGQPIISIADVQWVLHNAKSPATLKAEVLRGGKPVRLKLSLPEGWRRGTDLSWRATTWEMNRLVGGSLKWVNVSDADRKKLGLKPGATAIRVDFVGWWGPFQAGKRAGFKKGDVMVSFDGQRNLKTVSEFYEYAVNKTTRGKDVEVEILRGGKKMSLKIPMQ